MYIELAEVLKLRNYHTVLYTGKLQITARHLMPDEFIPEEVHKVDQVLQILEGRAIVVIKQKVRTYTAGEIVVVRAGKPHMVRPFPDNHITLLSTYSSPLHLAGEIVERGPKFGKTDAGEFAHR